MTIKDTNPKDAIGIAKAPLSCVPIPVLIELGVAMLEGASKYGRHNYRLAGIRYSVYFDATIRHLFSWWEGEDIDSDSGAALSHITKAIASLTVLRDCMIRNMAVDDRPPKTIGMYEKANRMAKEVLDRNSGAKPEHVTQQLVSERVKKALDSFEQCPDLSPHTITIDGEQRCPPNTN